MASLLRRIERRARGTTRRAAGGTRRTARRTERAVEGRGRRTIRRPKTGLEALLTPARATRRRTRRVQHKAEAPIVKLFGGGRKRRGG